MLVPRLFTGGRDCWCSPIIMFSSSWPTDRSHFPASGTVRCGHVTGFCSMECEQEWQGTTSRSIKTESRHNPHSFVIHSPAAWRGL